MEDVVEGGTNGDASELARTCRNGGVERTEGIAQDINESDRRSFWKLA